MRQFSPDVPEVSGERPELKNAVFTSLKKRHQKLFEGLEKHIFQ